MKAQNESQKDLRRRFNSSSEENSTSCLQKTKSSCVEESRTAFDAIICDNPKIVNDTFTVIVSSFLVSAILSVIIFLPTVARFQDTSRYSWVHAHACTGLFVSFTYEACVFVWTGETFLTAGARCLQ